MAQLVARLNGIQKVSGSSPLSSTNHTHMKLKILYNAIIIKVIVLITLALDQWSKEKVLTYFQNSAHPNSAIEITDFFNIVLTWNYGISFGLFNNPQYDQSIFMIITSIIIVGLILMFISHPKLQLPLGLIIGGAVGNLIDRFKYGAVLDFIDFHWMQHHYPAFNLADSAIFIGAILLFIFEAKYKN